MDRRLATIIAATAAFAVAATVAALGTRSDGGAGAPPGEDGVALESWSGRAGTARLLRPDMFSLRARDLQMSVRSGFRVLRFVGLVGLDQLVLRVGTQHQTPAPCRSGSMRRG